MEAGALVAEDEDRHGNVRQVYLTQDERVLFLEPEGNIFEPQARDLELYLRQTLSPGAYAAVMRALGEEPIIDL